MSVPAVAAATTAAPAFAAITATTTAGCILCENPPFLPPENPRVVCEGKVSVSDCVVCVVWE